MTALESLSRRHSSLSYSFEHVVKALYAAPKLSDGYLPSEV